SLWSRVVPAPIAGGRSRAGPVGPRRRAGSAAKAGSCTRPRAAGGRIRPCAIRVPAPVLGRQHTEIQGAAGESAEICERSHRAPVVEVLQDVVAEKKVEALLRRIARDARLHPAEAAAQVIARLEPDVTRARKDFPNRDAEVAEPAAGIEHAADRESQVCGVGAGEAAEAHRFSSRGDARLAVHVVTLVESGVEHRLKRKSEGTVPFFLRSFGK